MRIRKLVPLLVLLIATRPATAHLMYAWSYEEMFAKADLVVIAKPTSTADTEERSKLPGTGDVIALVGVNTTFETRLVLKGGKELKKFVLHHYRVAESKIAIVNGPALVSFDVKKPWPYLMFLVKEADGRYAPTTDQEDPGAFSIIRLDGSMAD